MRRSSKPKVKPRILKSTGQRIDPKTGRFLAKPGGPKSASTKAIEAGQSVMEILATRADAQRIARVLEKQAYAGNPSAIELMVRAVELQNQKQATQCSPQNLKRLSAAESAMLIDLLEIVEGKTVPLERRYKTLLTLAASYHDFCGTTAQYAVETLIHGLKHPAQPPPAGEQTKEQPEQPANAAPPTPATKPAEVKVVPINETRTAFPNQPVSTGWCRSAWRSYEP